MDLLDFATYVQQMRDDQKAYFEHRTPTNLAAAKSSERMIDRMLRQILPQPVEPVMAQQTLPLPPTPTPSPALRAD